MYEITSRHVCVCANSQGEWGVPFSGTDRLFLRFMPLSVKFPSASKVHPGSLLSSSLSLSFSFILPSSYLFSFFSRSFYLRTSFFPLFCYTQHPTGQHNFSPSIIGFRLSNNPELLLRATKASLLLFWNKTVRNIDTSNENPRERSPRPLHLSRSPLDVRLLTDMGRLSVIARK